MSRMVSFTRMSNIINSVLFVPLVTASSSTAINIWFNISYFHQYNKCLVDQSLSLSARRQKGLTGYYFKYIDRAFCLRADKVLYAINIDAENHFAYISLLMAVFL